MVVESSASLPVALDWNDEVVARTALTHAGEIRNEAARKALENVRPG